MVSTQEFMERMRMSPTEVAAAAVEREKVRKYQTEVAEKLRPITGKIVDAAYNVHKELGPGLLESVYEACMVYELEQRGLGVRRQVAVPVIYRSALNFDEAYRLDLLVEGKVVVELKAVEKVSAVHKAQLLTYMKLSGHKVGLLLTFNAALMKDGITRMIL